MTTYSEKSFAVCPCCGAKAEEFPGKVEADTFTSTDGRLIRWTRCQICNKKSRQRYNFYLHTFIEPDYVWRLK
jgi:hypothetical protein